MAEQRLTHAQQERARRTIRPWLATLLRTATYLTHDATRAEDLVQETVLKASRAIDRFQDGTDPKAWLLTILRRTHIDGLRHKARQPTTLSLDHEQASEVADDGDGTAGVFDEHWDNPESMMQAFADDELITALKALPTEIRWTLLLVDVEQMDHAGAAQVLDVPNGTVKSRAHRGRAMLRDRLHHVAEQRGWVKQSTEGASP